MNAETVNAAPSGYAPPAPRTGAPRVQLAYPLTLAGGIVTILSAIVGLGILAFITGGGLLAAMVLVLFAFVPLGVGVASILMALRVRDDPSRDRGLVLVVLGAVAMATFASAIGGLLILAAGILLMLDGTEAPRAAH